MADSGAVELRDGAQEAGAVPMIHLGELLVAGGCLLAGSLVAGAEAAVSSLPPARLRALHDEIVESRRRHLARYLDDPTRVLAKLLSFRVTMILIAAVLSTNALCAGRDPWWKLAAMVAALSYAYSLLAEVFMTVGRARARSLAPAALAFTRPVEILMTPVAAPLSWLGRAIYSSASSRQSSDPAPLTEREFEYVVEEAEEAGALDHKRGEMLQNVLELKDMRARDVMVPRTRMHALEASTAVDTSLAVVTEEGHSRVPVYRGQVDNIVGVLHVKDLFRLARDPNALRNSTPPGAAKPTIESIARKPAFFVPETQSALAVLREMQSRRTHMAMVVDEFGSIAGLVTLEDILEQLVGDIQDEHDTDEAQMVEKGDGHFEVAAAVHLNKLGERLGVEFPESETYASLGGFLAERAGKVPGVGTAVSWGGFRFTVREGDRRRVTKVEIEREAQGEAASPVQVHAAES